MIFMLLSVVLLNYTQKYFLLYGRKVMTNLDSIFKSRDITLPTNQKMHALQHSWQHYYNTQDIETI